MEEDCDLIVMSQPYPQPSTNGDFPYIVEARLSDGGLRIVVVETKYQDQLRNKGFGENEKSDYVLRSYEALYLLYTKRLILKDKKNSYDFNALIKKILKYDNDTLTRFLIYRDIRSRGYVAKDGFGFGIDFRLYDRGEFEKNPAKYVLFGINEGVNKKVKDFLLTIEQVEKMGKAPVIAVIESRGEIIYYKVSKVRVMENKKEQ